VREAGLTALVASERLPGGSLSRYGIGEFVSDGVIELTTEPGQEQLVRRVMVRKLRGMGYRGGSVEFEISPRGVEVFPKAPVDRSFAVSDFKARKRFGVPELDRLVGGGLPEGALVLIAGDTGTGKTTFCCQFIAEGFRAGEPAVFVALEEPSGQLRRTASASGWGFGAQERKGMLAIIDIPLIDIRPDQFLYRVMREVSRIGAKRVVIDSISSMRSASMSFEKVRQFSVQVSEYIKSQGITCVMSALIPGGGHGEGMLPISGSFEMRLSSVVDGMILQRHVEDAARIRKALTVLKLRGSTHETAVVFYELGRRGVRVLGPEGGDSGTRRQGGRSGRRP